MTPMCPVDKRESKSSLSKRWGHTTKITKLENSQSPGSHSAHLKKVSGGFWLLFQVRTAAGKTAADLLPLPLSVGQSLSQIWRPAGHHLIYLCTQCITIKFRMCPVDKRESKSSLSKKWGHTTKITKLESLQSPGSHSAHLKKVSGGLWLLSQVQIAAGETVADLLPLPLSVR